MRRAALALASLAVLGSVYACGGSGGSGNDGSVPIPDRQEGGVDGGDGAATEASTGSAANEPACDTAKPFGAPVAIAELNTPDEDVLTDLSPDELTAYVATNHGVAGSHLFYATRTSRTGTFGALAPLFPSGAWDDWNVGVSADGLTAIVSTNRPNQTQKSDLFIATRTSTTSAFGALGLAATLSSAAEDQGPKFSADGKTLYFDSERTGARDLYRATVSPGVFGAPQPITELNSADLDAIPVISADELTIYFTTLRAPTPSGDIWVATRGKKGDPFGTPKPVAEVNSPDGVEAASAISADGCRLYLTSSKGTGHYDIYVATRPR